MIQKTLTSRLIANESNAWAEFVSTWTPKLTAYFTKRIKDRNTVDDLVQETFISLMCAIHSYDCTRPLENWVITIASRRFADYMRQSSRLPENIGDFDKAECGDHWQVLKEVQHNEDVHLTLQGIDSVLEGEKEADLARAVLDETQKTGDIAKRFNVRYQHVTDKRFQVKTKIRKVCRV